MVIILYRLNCQITEEAEAILKAEAKRLGTSLGVIVTMMALEKKKQDDALDAIALYRQDNQEKMKGV